tara:strand:- start:3102 stop:3239 length:138 start_codon:yes stop_codon:yes gene_type:complete
MTKAQKIAWIQKQAKGAKFASTKKLFKYHESVLDVMINNYKRGMK